MGPKSRVDVAEQFAALGHGVDPIANLPAQQKGLLAHPNLNSIWKPGAHPHGGDER
jgi:hypothetical protein